MKNARRMFAMLLALTLLCGAGLAEMVFDGVVTGGDAQFVLAPFGGVMDEVNVRVGDRVQPGQALASIQTTRVYADVEGKISGVFGREGDATEGVSERYGGVLFIEPTNKYTIAASTEKAYNRSENKFIHVGETVYLKCTSDGSHRGTGVVTGMGAAGDDAVKDHFRQARAAQKHKREQRGEYPPCLSHAFSSISCAAISGVQAPKA